MNIEEIKCKKVFFGKGNAACDTSPKHHTNTSAEVAESKNKKKKN